MISTFFQILIPKRCNSCSTQMTLKEKCFFRSRKRRSNNKVMRMNSNTHRHSNSGPPLFPHLVPPAIMVWIFVWKYNFEPFIHILQHFVLQLSRSTNFCFQVQLPYYIISNTAAGPRNKSQQNERVVTRNVVKYGKWFKVILPDKDPYHNRGRDQMRKKGGPEFECLWFYLCTYVLSYDI